MELLRPVILSGAFSEVERSRGRYVKACATGSLDFARDDQALAMDAGLTSMLDVERWAFSSALIPQGIHSLPDDAIDQLRIRQARLSRRLGEIFVFCQDRIWIRLDEINFVVRR